MSVLIENPTGEGYILRGDVRMAQVSYDVRVFQKYDDASHLTGGGAVPTLKTIDCILNTLPNSVKIGDSLTLVMADGRKLNLFVNGPGTVRATGAMYTDPKTAKISAAPLRKSLPSLRVLAGQSGHCYLDAQRTALELVPV